MKINLHTHSNYSLDGEYTVKELIEKLKNNGFDIISITDHDTCAAYKEIQKDSSIKIITGIEADAIANNHTYDFLCYNFDLDKVAVFAEEQYESVEKRQSKIFKALVDGYTCEEISKKYHYSTSTICNRRRDIYNKTLKYMM